jgi:hypothetical protein
VQREKYNAKQFLDRSGETVRFMGYKGYQISRQPTHECGKTVSLRTGRLYLQETFLVLISVRGYGVWNIDKFRKLQRYLSLLKQMRKYGTLFKSGNNQAVILDF